jgi:hypothetical protein
MANGDSDQDYLQQNDQLALQLAKQKLGQQMLERFGQPTQQTSATATSAQPASMPGAGQDENDFAIPLGWRVGYEEQLTPAVRDKLFRFTHAEEETGGAAAQQAFMEEIINGANALGVPIETMLASTAERRALAQQTGNQALGKYFPEITQFRAAHMSLTPDQTDYYNNMLNDVIGGSNVGKYPTGNASIDPQTGRYVGFSGGPITLQVGPKGERFGQEGWSRGWAQSHGYAPEDSSFPIVARTGGPPIGSGMNTNVASSGTGGSAPAPNTDLANGMLGVANPYLQTMLIQSMLGDKDGLFADPKQRALDAIGQTLKQMQSSIKPPGIKNAG